MDKKAVVDFIVEIIPFISIGGGIAFVYFTLKLMKFWGTVEEKLKKTDKINESIFSIGENFSEIKGTLNLINSRLDKVEGGYFQAQSPVNLTDKGRELVKEEGLESSIINKWDEIKDFIDSNCKGMNPYDIQEFLFTTSLTQLDKLLDKEGLEKIKTRAYNEGVPLALFAKIVAILVRNKYLEEKGILTDDIDKHDPLKK